MSCCQINNNMDPVTQLRIQRALQNGNGNGAVIQPIVVPTTTATTAAMAAQPVVSRELLIIVVVIIIIIIIIAVIFFVFIMMRRSSDGNGQMACPSYIPTPSFSSNQSYCVYPMGFTSPTYSYPTAYSGAGGGIAGPCNFVMQ